MQKYIAQVSEQVCGRGEEKEGMGRKDGEKEVWRESRITKQRGRHEGIRRWGEEMEGGDTDRGSGGCGSSGRRRTAVRVYVIRWSRLPTLRRSAKPKPKERKEKRKGKGMVRHGQL
jgi:hypothetical protein